MDLLPPESRPAGPATETCHSNQCDRPVETHPSIDCPADSRYSAPLHLAMVDESL